ncbi:MAG: DUF3473 domain-containing protein [Planctomycetales bacterium]|nr:DUF3473 domain-containing protein [Planctomycetales bacterium]MCB0418483.1 DUF3473 domain-containing protein [Bdellovibrionales bacterium]MCB9255106.1 DUF3473 domain-containing protein [Pseudobdellovibrionaceae bacterium]
MGEIALSIDVEDWFCVRNMGQKIPFKEWNQCEFRVRKGLDFILEELSQRNLRATFFVLGWVAERSPQIVRELKSAGHEIGSHGYNHQPLDLTDPVGFKKDVEQSLAILSSQAELPIEGYRAPSFSITRDTYWALGILRDLGFRYDSSIYPVRHPDYGIPDFPTSPTQTEGIWEVPMSRVNLFGMRVPVSGGGYFRLYPYSLTRSLLKKAQRDGDVVLYFHPWEFDENQPRVSLPPLKKFRHYVGLEKNREKFRRLLDDFPVKPVRELLH